MDFGINAALYKDTSEEFMCSTESLLNRFQLKKNISHRGKTATEIKHLNILHNFQILKTNYFYKYIQTHILHLEWLRNKI
jgi:hypothetical protein